MDTRLVLGMSPPGIHHLPLLHSHSSHLSKGLSPISFQKHKGSRKLFKVSPKTISHHFMLRICASVGSSNADLACKQNVISSSFSTPSDLTRWSWTLPHSSTKPTEAMNELEMQLQELFGEVKMMVKMGNISDAVDLLQANYEIVEEQISDGARSIQEAATLDVIALGYLAIGDLKFVRFLMNMLSQIVNNLKDDEPLLESILTHMGSIYSSLGMLEQSMIVYQRAINILENRYGKDSTFLVSTLLGIAKVLSSIGRTTKAVEVYHRAITILESSKGLQSEDLVVPLFGLGNVLIKEGRPKDAESPFMRILGIYTNLYGSDDGRVGMALCSMAHVKCAAGNLEEAVDLYKRALKVIKDANYMALDDGIMEKMRIDLAELLHVVGRGQEGRKLLEECLLITENQKGKEHPSLVLHLLNLASSYSQSKNFVEAEHLLRTSLNIMLKNVGPDDQSITFPMLHLAVTLYNLNQDEEAEQLALEALRIRKEAFGKDSLPVGEALDCLISIQTRLGKNDLKLLELLKEVLMIQEKHFGYESEEVMPTLKKVIFYLDKLGMKDEKLPMQRRLSVLKNKYMQTVRR